MFFSSTPAMTFDLSIDKATLIIKNIDQADYQLFVNTFLNSGFDVGMKRDLPNWGKFLNFNEFTHKNPTKLCQCLLEVKAKLKGPVDEGSFNSLLSQISCTNNSRYEP